MEKIDLICIGCPMGCPITVEMENGEVVSVTGNTCPRGDAYARKEVTNPTRIVTSTVRVTGGIFDCVKALKDVEIPAPVTIGQVVLKDAAGTGVDIIATKNVPVA